MAIMSDKEPSRGKCRHCGSEGTSEYPLEYCMDGVLQHQVFPCPKKKCETVIISSDDVGEMPEEILNGIY